MVVYLLHFERPDETPEHYIGFTERPIKYRYSEHEKLRTPTTAKWLNAGYSMRLAHLWVTGTLDDERLLHKLFYADSEIISGFCPCCDWRVYNIPKLPFRKTGIKLRRYRLSKTAMAAKHHEG